MSLQKVPHGKHTLKRHFYHALAHTDISLPRGVFGMITAGFFLLPATVSSSKKKPALRQIIPPSSERTESVDRAQKEE